MILHPPPGDNGMSEWGFAHSRDHDDVIEKIRTATGIVLPVLQIDPIPSDFKGWASRHQSMHNDSNGILQTDGSDLETVDWQDAEERESWFFLHYQEHLAWHKRLGS